MAELTRANAISDRLMQTSPNVNRLIHRLRENLSAQDRSVIEDRLVTEFEAGLYQGGVPPVMVPALAQMLVRVALRGIRMVLTQHGDSIVVYFLCKTVQVVRDKRFRRIIKRTLKGLSHVTSSLNISQC